MNLPQVCDYLEEIGIIDTHTINDFLMVYSSIVQLSMPSIQKTFKFALFKFLKSKANDEGLEWISSKILDNYQKTRAIKRYTNMTKLFSLLYRSYDRFKFAAFYNIKTCNINGRNNAGEHPLNIENKGLDSVVYNTGNPNLSGDLKDLCRHFFSIQSTKEKIEQEELAECTFRPKISENYNNNSIKKPRNSENTHDKLYLESQIKQDKKTMQMIHQLEKEGRELTFTPHLKKSKSLSSIRYTRKNFIDKQNDFDQKKREKLLQLHLKKMKELNSCYTFQPTINSQYEALSKDNQLEIQQLSDTPRYVKLSNDDIVRKQRLANKKAKIEKEFQSMNPLNKFRSKSSNNLNLSDNHPSYYEKLYNDAKVLQQKKRELITNSYAKMTFSPVFRKNRKFALRSTFTERNEKLISLKEELRNKMEKDKKEAEKKRRANMPSKEERKRNNQDVIARLYNKAMEGNKLSKPHSTGNKLINMIQEEHQIKFKRRESAKQGMSGKENRKIEVKAKNSTKTSDEFLNCEIEEIDEISRSLKQKLDTVPSNEDNSVKMEDNVSERSHSTLSYNAPLKDNSRAAELRENKSTENIHSIPVERIINQSQFKSQALLNLLQNKAKDIDTI